MPLQKPITLESLIRGERFAEELTAQEAAAMLTALAGIQLALANRILTAKPRLVMDVKTIQRGGHNIAVLYNDWHGTATDERGRTVRLQGCAVEVVRRQADGRWLYVVDDPDAHGCGGGCVGERRGSQRERGGRGQLRITRFVHDAPVLLPTGGA